MLCAGLALAACAGARPAAPDKTAAQSIGLFTTLPILWAESEELRGLLASDAPMHWALAALRRHGAVRALDTFLADDSAPPLAGVGLLIMAQPRALAPQENVALDGWVRAGGRLLLLADPLLTEESTYAFGDRRRPQDVVLLSPILAHWGLRLTFDDEQPAGERVVALLGGKLPVNLPGQLTRTRSGRGCALLAGGIAASCRIGRGKVLIIADAALLEKDRPASAAGNHEMLDRLLAAFEPLP